MITINGKPMTMERMGWWFRIALTRVFGRKVQIDGRTGPIKVLPWVHKGKILLMGLEQTSVSVSFSNQYTTHLQEAPRLEPREQAKGDVSDLPVWIVVLGHQKKSLIERAFSRFQTLGPGYRHLLAYGGTMIEFDSLTIHDKIFIDDPSLRGPSHRMSHRDLIQKSWDFIQNRTEGSCFICFTESDLLPLNENYLDGCLRQMTEHGADFGAKEIRDLSRTNNPFLIDAITRGIIRPDQQDCLHALGCFFIIRSCIIPKMLEYCAKWDGLYFEIMFPSAAVAAGGEMLGFQSVCRDLDHVVYRPEYSPEQVEELAKAGVPMVHPFKPN